MTAWITKRTLDGVGDWFIVALVALALMAGLRWALIDVRNYIDVEAIKIEDAVEGERIQMTVARVLHDDFRGKWSVEIRNGRTGEAICYTGLLPNNSFWNYREFSPSGSRTELPNPLYLDHWTGGDCSEVLGGPVRAPTLKPGLYVQETTHCVKAYWWLYRKCNTWDASTFRIYSEEQADG